MQNTLIITVLEKSSTFPTTSTVPIRKSFFNAVHGFCTNHGCKTDLIKEVNTINTIFIELSPKRLFRVNYTKIFGTLLN